MIVRLFECAALALAWLDPLAPAHAEFYTVAQMRSLCRGEVNESADFRTEAAYALLARTYRDRCRMYLLGVTDDFLAARPGQTPPRVCLPREATETEVADVLVAALVEPGSQAETLTDFVRRVLEDRYRCT